MDFSWTQEQNELYSNTLSLVQDKLNTRSVDMHQPWTRAQWLLCGSLNLLGLSVAEMYGGGGHNALTTAHVVEAFGRGCENTGLVFSAAAHLFACAMPIAEYGSDGVKNALLPALCSGTFVGANAITEKDAGSDVFALKTCAIREDDVYILEGHKSYVSNGPAADVFVVYAKTNPAHGYLGMTGFVVERNSPGLIISEPFHKVGLTSTPACEITFDGCRIPVANRLGKEGQGSQIFKWSMQWERACLFALYLGQMDRQIERTIVYAKERYQFGKPLGKHQAVAHCIANMKLRLEAARLLLYRTCWCLDQGQDVMLDISLSKLAVSEAAIQSALDAVHIHGSVGINDEYGIEQMLRDALPGTLFSGTSEMQRDIIASELGL